MAGADNKKVRPLYSFLKKRRCAQCWGPVRDRQLDDGDWEIYCPKECSPGGHVSEAYVELRRAYDALDFAKAADNYPELDPFTSSDDDHEIQSLF